MQVTKLTIQSIWFPHVNSGNFYRIIQCSFSSFNIANYRICLFQCLLILCIDYDYKEQWPPICSVINRNVLRIYDDRKQVLRNRLPILKWLPTYRLSYLFYDFIAGLTVGLTAIPQGIAYAIVAGLPPQYGLYSGFIGSFVYLIFGSSKDVTIGKWPHQIEQSITYRCNCPFWNQINTVPFFEYRANCDFIIVDSSLCSWEFWFRNIFNTY